MPCEITRAARRMQTDAERRLWFGEILTNTEGVVRQALRALQALEAPSPDRGLTPAATLSRGAGEG